MAIAKDERLVTHVSQLPPSVGHLYELSRLDDETFKAGIDRKLIHPEMERADIKKIIARPVPLFDRNVPLPVDDSSVPDDFADVERVWTEAAITSDRLTGFLGTVPACEADRWRGILAAIRAACDGGLDLLGRAEVIQSVAAEG
jgi:hypothetical protein